MSLEGTVSIEFSKSFIINIEECAYQRGIDREDWIAEAVKEKMNKEKEMDTEQSLKGLLIEGKLLKEIEQQIAKEGRNCSISKWVEETCEKELQMKQFKPVLSEYKFEKESNNTYKDEQLYEDAAEVFGVEAQFKKAIEETNELSLALIQYMNEKMTMNDVISEIADMKIIIDQLISMYDEQGKVADTIEEKKLKLKNMINREKNK